MIFKSKTRRSDESRRGTWETLGLQSITGRDTVEFAEPWVVVKGEVPGRKEMFEIYA